MQNNVLGILFDNKAKNILLRDGNGIYGFKNNKESFKEAMDRTSSLALEIDLNWHYAGLIKGTNENGNYNEAIFFAYSDSILDFDGITRVYNLMDFSLKNSRLRYLIPYGVEFLQNKGVFMNLEFFSVNGSGH